MVDVLSHTILNQIEVNPYEGFLKWGVSLIIHLNRIFHYTPWLWLTVRHGFSMALIEIDGDYRS